MAEWKTVKLRLSKGVRIPKWVRWLQSVEIGTEKVCGRRVRFLKCRRATAHFGQQGSVWLTLPEVQASFRYFPNTFQILGARDRVLENNIFLCLRCFALSGRLLGEPEEITSARVKAEFACTNEGCTEKWTREW